jgi:ABC-type multidrug transport system fused ATPase/permease subunit
MACALLRRSSVIILGEATSSIDFATDTKIQATIREEFNNSLLLTVAHRLQTGVLPSCPCSFTLLTTLSILVIGYDCLVVLDEGWIAELGTSYNLIQKEDTRFRPAGPPLCRGNLNPLINPMGSYGHWWKHGDHMDLVFL